MVVIVRGLQNCTFESGYTYTMIVYLTVRPAVTGACLTRHRLFGSDITRQDRSSTLTIDRQTLGGIASSSDITRRNGGDEIDRSGAIKTKAVPTTTVVDLAEEWPLRNSSSICDSMRAHQATGRSRQDDYTRFKDSGIRLRQISSLRFCGRQGLSLTLNRRPSSSSSRRTSSVANPEDPVEQDGFRRRITGMARGSFHGGNTNGRERQKFIPKVQPQVSKKTTRRTTLHHAGCSGRNSMAETKALTIVD